MNKLHLICNAHLDPAWLWQIEEGAGEALSTFRIAADFCESFDGFVFNHNEVILYQWVEEYDPALFKRIQKLAAEGRWHIMGGWYLQPDCNMPSGESFVRQILAGRRYFAEKFGVRPTTAINFDPFGHTRGLVQIMSKAGFDSYIVCRPGDNDCPLPGDEFVWVGYDGSEVIGHRAYKAYLSGRGRAHIKVEGFMTDYPDKRVGMVLWGIGNHGGGPSKIDLENLQELRTRTATHEIVHSTPEAYFAELRAGGAVLPRHEGDLNPWAVGCYTSQIRIKQKHRLLENELYAIEKMMSSAALQGLAAYPHKELQEAQEDLLKAEFHDILPGSSIRLVEEDSLRLMDHGLELLSRLKARAFFALTAGEAKAKEATVPLFLYNPHPYKVKGVFECEFQLPESSKGQFANPVVFRDGVRQKSQVEKELSNLYIDWRKRVVFYAELEPSSMNRFDCGVEFMPEKPKPELAAQGGKLVFDSGVLRVVINTATGFVDEYSVNGVPMLKEQAFRPIVMEDRDDSWGQVHSFPKQAGTFKLMSKARAKRYSGLKGKPLESVRVIEDGAVRTVVEALFEYRESMIAMRYNLPKAGTELRLDLVVHWNEKRSLLKLAIPTALTMPRYRGQVAYGADDLRMEGREVVSQKWTAAVSDQDGLAFSCINNGIYGSDMTDGEIRLTLLRSPGYSALPGGSMPHNTMPADRFSDRIDQGERRYSFWFSAGSAAERLAAIDREALAWNEQPYALTYFPSGAGEKALPLATLSDESVLMTAFKRAEDNEDDYIVRLFEPTGTARKTTLSLPPLGISESVSLNPFEIRTYRVCVRQRRLAEETLLEERNQCEAEERPS